jgi:uncharacterized protein (TIGR00255 family)
MSGTLLSSMTAFARRECPPIQGQKYRLELRSVNGRSLELKVRTPKELQGLEPLVREWFQKKLSRGTCDLRIERVHSNHTQTQNAPAEINLSLAAHYYESLVRLQKTLGLTDAIQTRDLLSFSDLFQRPDGAVADSQQDAELWSTLLPELEQLMNQFVEQRRTEGARIGRVFSSTIDSLQNTLVRVRDLRETWKSKARAKLEERIQSVFELHPLTKKDVQAVLESRIAQELALLLERADIEEEIERASGHLDHLKRTLGDHKSGPLGKKLEFVLQELHREFNTLGTKAQDLSIHEEIVNAKVMVDQLREQSLNLE